MSRRHRAGQYGRTSAGVLPGQRGYGQKESERLAEETRQMEHKLLALRRTIEQSKATAPRAGGGWKSAAPERGSLRNYSSSVRKRQNSKKKTGAKSSKSIRHNVGSWGSHEVGCWLRAIGLERYVSIFKANEITGNVLLDVGLDDLDYMKIEVLGHRKVIMREIEKLRRGKSTVDLSQDAPPRRADGGDNTSPQQQQRMDKRRQQLEPEAPSLSPSPPRGHAGSGGRSRSGGSPSRSTDYSSASLQRGRSVAARAASIQASPKNRVHWSQARKLSENTVTDGGLTAVNLADGTYDEEAQQKSFQEAVAAWRNGSGALSGSGVKNSAGGDGMWTNPFATAEPGGKLLEGVLDEEAEHEGFRKAVEDWRRAGESSTPASVSTATAATTTRVASSGVKKMGELDEEEEHKRFQSAVRAWRTGEKADGDAAAVRKAADELEGKMAREHDAKRAAIQRERVRLEEEMQKGREDLRRRREEAEKNMYASKVEEPHASGGSNTGYQPKSYRGIWDVEIEY